jgi:periplasmic divalent cation tolerance protein
MYMQTYFVYITTKDIDQARQIGKTLVEEHVAACVNILPGMQSIYRWQDAVEEAAETVLIAKTTEEQIPHLQQRVCELHSYECPCIIALPIVAGFPPYLEWIMASGYK